MKEDFKHIFKDAIGSFSSIPENIKNLYKGARKDAFKFNTLTARLVYSLSMLIYLFVAIIIFVPVQFYIVLVIFWDFIMSLLGRRDGRP